MGPQGLVTALTKTGYKPSRTQGGKLCSETSGSKPQKTLPGLFLKPMHKPIV